MSINTTRLRNIASLWRWPFVPFVPCMRFHSVSIAFPWRFHAVCWFSVWVSLRLVRVRQVQDGVGDVVLLEAVLMSCQDPKYDGSLSADDSINQGKRRKMKLGGIIGLLVLFLLYWASNRCFNFVNTFEKHFTQKQCLITQKPLPAPIIAFIAV